MNFINFNILAVVPARGGSKSIPRKNLCKIDGISLVGRAGMLIKSLTWINAAVLSTDDEDISEEGRRFGLDTPFVRPAEISGDRATSVEMWKHAWIESEKFYNKKFDISILLEPTSPLREVGDIEKAVSKITDEGYSSAATVSRTPGHYTPQKTLIIDDQGLINFYHSDGSSHSLRQSIPDYFHRNGLCYALTREHLFQKNVIIDSSTAPIIIDRHVVNIDEPFELQMAEWILKATKSHKHDNG